MLLTTIFLSIKKNVEAVCMLWKGLGIGNKFKTIINESNITNKKTKCGLNSNSKIHRNKKDT